MSFEDMAYLAANPKNLPVEFVLDKTLVRTVVEGRARRGSSPRTCATFSDVANPAPTPIGRPGRGRDGGRYY